MGRQKDFAAGLETRDADTCPAFPSSKFEVWGEEMIQKEVRQSGNSGRVYLPLEWVGSHVKIIRVD